MTDDMARTLNDAVCLTIIADRLNEIGDAIEVIDALSWPGATLEQIDEGLETLDTIREGQGKLVDLMVDLKRAYADKLGISSMSNAPISHTPTSDENLKRLGERMREGA